MHSMRKPVLVGLLAAAAFGVAQTASAGGDAKEYVVLYEQDTVEAYRNAELKNLFIRLTITYSDVKKFFGSPVLAHSARARGDQRSFPLFSQRSF